MSASRTAACVATGSYLAGAVAENDPVMSMTTSVVTLLNTQNEPSALIGTIADPLTICPTCDWTTDVNVRPTPHG